MKLKKKKKNKHLENGDSNGEGFPMHRDMPVGDRVTAGGEPAHALEPIHHGDLRAELREMKNRKYEKELAKLQIELVKLQQWIKHKGLKVVVIFEGATRRGRGA